PTPPPPRRYRGGRISRRRGGRFVPARRCAPAPRARSGRGVAAGRGACGSYRSSRDDVPERAFEEQPIGAVISAVDLRPGTHGSGVDERPRLAGERRARFYLRLPTGFAERDLPARVRLRRQALPLSYPVGLLRVFQEGEPVGILPRSPVARVDVEGGFARGDVVTHHPFGPRLGRPLGWGDLDRVHHRGRGELHGLLARGNEGQLQRAAAQV